MPSKITPAPAQAQPQSIENEQNIESNKPESNGVSVGNGAERIEMRNSRNQEAEFIKLEDKNLTDHPDDSKKMVLGLDGVAGLRKKKVVFRGDAAGGLEVVKLIPKIEKKSIIQSVRVDGDESPKNKSNQHCSFSDLPDDEGSGESDGEVDFSRSELDENTRLNNTDFEDIEELYLSWHAEYESEGGEGEEEGHADQGSKLVGRSNDQAIGLKSRGDVADSGLGFENKSEYIQPSAEASKEISLSKIDFPPSCEDINVDNSFEGAAPSGLPAPGMEKNPYLESSGIGVDFEFLNSPTITPVGKSEIEGLRSFIFSLDEWEREILNFKGNVPSEYGVAKASDPSRMKFGLDKISRLREELKECAPFKDAVKIFNRAHDLAKSVERTGPKGQVIPAGFTFFDADLEELSLLSALVLEVIKDMEGDVGFIQNLVNSLKSDRSPSDLLGMPKPEPIVINDVHKTLRDGSRYGLIRFGDGSAEVSSFIMPVVFWADLFFSGHRQEPDRVPAYPLDWLERKVDYQITVISGSHNSDVITEPKSWREWAIENLQNFVQYPDFDNSN